MGRNDAFRRLAGRQALAGLSAGVACTMHRLSDMSIDRTLEGARCHLVRGIVHQGGYLRPHVEGTIRYALENLGRTLLWVKFDTGASLIVLSDDIAIDVRSD